jgi:hypothetical protein
MPCRWTTTCGWRTGPRWSRRRGGSRSPRTTATSPAPPRGASGWGCASATRAPGRCARRTWSPTRSSTRPAAGPTCSSSCCTRTPSWTGWDDPHLAEALDLCLSCKACKAECPTGVDLATLKAEVLARRFAGRRRPLEHYTLGRVRWWLRVRERRLPGLANAVGGLAPGRLAREAVGVTDAPAGPALAAEPFSVWWRARGGSRVEGPPVLLFVDTFTETLDPRVGRAAVEVLEAAGHRVVVPTGRSAADARSTTTACSTRRWRSLRRLVEVLAPAAHGGVPIVGLEPSCVAALRDELPSLLTATRTQPSSAVRPGRWPSTSTRGRMVAAAAPAGTTALVHGHCHHEAVMGTEAPTHGCWRPPGSRHGPRMPAAAGSPARSATATASRTRSRSRPANGSCCRRCARRRRTRCSSPTASRAGPRSPTCSRARAQEARARETRARETPAWETPAWETPARVGRSTSPNCCAVSWTARS